MKFQSLLSAKIEKNISKCRLHKRRLAGAFTSRPLDKYSILMCWIKASKIVETLPCEMANVFAISSLYKKYKIMHIIAHFLVCGHSPVSILHKSIAGRYRPVRVADGPITARYRFIKNASKVRHAIIFWGSSKDFLTRPQKRKASFAN